MAYDTSVTSSTLQLELKRKIFRIDVQRPGGTKKSTYANTYFNEDTLDATPGSPTSGSVLSTAVWRIETDKDQTLDVQGANNFINGMIALMGSLKTEYDLTGSLATGSVERLS